MIATLTGERVEEMILAALADVNDELGDDEKIDVCPTTALLASTQRSTPCRWCR